MRNQKPLATRYYQLKCGYAHTATYLKGFSQRDDDQCWWCEKAVWTGEHLFRHCRNEQQQLWKAVGRKTEYKSGRCRYVQTLILFSLEMCDQTVMDFLAVTEVGKFPYR